MIWGCITWSGRGTLCKINGNMNAEKYISILDEQLLPVIVRHFPDNSYIFQVTRHKYHRNLLASGEEKFAKTGRRNFYQISCSILFLTFGRMSQLITLKSCIIPYHGEFLFAFDQRDTSQGTKGMWIFLLCWKRRVYHAKRGNSHWRPPFSANTFGTRRCSLDVWSSHFFT